MSNTSNEVACLNTATQKGSSMPHQRVLHKKHSFSRSWSIPCDAILARYMLSSCFHLSVCLSVTRLYCTKMAKRKIMQTMPYDSPWTLVFWCHRFRWNSNGVTHNGSAKKRWGRFKSAIFDQHLAVSQKKKLSIHRGNVLRTMLVNLCYFSQDLGVNKVSNSIRDLQGHWQWCQLIGHMRFPIRLPLQLCLYLSPFPRYYHLFPKI